MITALAVTALVVALAALLVALWAPLVASWRPPPPPDPYMVWLADLERWLRSPGAALDRYQHPPTLPPPDYPPWNVEPRCCGGYRAPVTWQAVPARRAQEAALLALTGSDRSRSEVAA